MARIMHTLDLVMEYRPTCFSQITPSKLIPLYGLTLNTKAQQESSPSKKEFSASTCFLQINFKYLSIFIKDHALLSTKDKYKKYHQSFHTQEDSSVPYLQSCLSSMPTLLTHLKYPSLQASFFKIKISKTHHRMLVKIFKKRSVRQTFSNSSDT